MDYYLRIFQRLVWILLLCFLIFVILGPQVAYSPIQQASLSIRHHIYELYQDTFGSKVQTLKDNISRNPIQDSMDRREREYALAFEEATGEQYREEEQCLTMFGLIPLNCPDPSGNGNISPDSPEEFSLEECMNVLQLPANLCRQW